MSKMPQALKIGELVNFDALRKIVFHWEKLPMTDEKKTKVIKIKNRKVHVSGMIKSYKNICGVENGVGTFVSEFNYSDITKNFGRRYGNGLQSMPGIIRRTIAHGLYNDIDTVNSYSTIIIQWCEKRKVPSHCYDGFIYYTKNRDECLQELMDIANIDRKKAKEIINAVSFGGYKLANALRYKPNWLDDIIKNTHNIHFIMANDQTIDKKYMKAAKKKFEQDKVEAAMNGEPEPKRSLSGSICSYVMQDIEDQILTSCYSFLTSKGCSTVNVVPVFDGS